MKTFNAQKAARLHAYAMQTMTHKVVGQTGALYGYHDSEESAQQHADVLNKTGCACGVAPVAEDERIRVAHAGHA